MLILCKKCLQNSCSRVHQDVSKQERTRICQIIPNRSLDHSQNIFTCFPSCDGVFCRLSSRHSPLYLRDKQPKTARYNYKNRNQTKLNDLFGLKLERLPCAGVMAYCIFHARLSLSLCRTFFSFFSYVFFYFFTFARGRRVGVACVLIYENTDKNTGYREC